MAKHIENQIERADIAQSDLMTCSQYIEYILAHDLLSPKNTESSLERSAFLTALVVTYSREFQKSKGSKSDIPGTLPERHLRSLCKDERSLHDKVIALRSSTFAHADGDVFETEHYDAGLIGKVRISRNPVPALCKEELYMLNEIIGKISSSVFEHAVELKGRTSDPSNS